MKSNFSNEWMATSTAIPNDSRRVAVRWDSARLKANGKQPINDDFGYFNHEQNWWVTENGESPNKSYPHYWKD